jgi:hypothetical protein
MAINGGATMQNEHRQSAIEPLTVSVRRSAEITGLTTRTIWRKISAGQLETTKPADTRRTLIVYASLKAYLSPAKAA